MGNAARLRAAILLALGATAVANEAHAEGGAYVNPGLLFGPAYGNGGGFAYGAELSFMYYPTQGDFLGAGAFAQAQRVTTDGGFSRLAAGLQAGGPLGLELGVARLFPSETHTATTALHLAPFFSLGIVTSAVHIDIPVSGDDARFSTYVGIQLGIKLPMPMGDPPRFGMGSPGRELAVRGLPRVAPLVRQRSCAWRLRASE